MFTSLHTSLVCNYLIRHGILFFQQTTSVHVHRTAGHRETSGNRHVQRHRVLRRRDGRDGVRLLLACGRILAAGVRGRPGAQPVLLRVTPQLSNRIDRPLGRVRPDRPSGRHDDHRRIRRAAPMAVRPPAPAQRARPDGRGARGHRVPRLGRRPMRRRWLVTTTAGCLRFDGIPARRAHVPPVRGQRRADRQADGALAVAYGGRKVDAFWAFVVDIQYLHRYNLLKHDLN